MARGTEQAMVRPDAIVREFELASMSDGNAFKGLVARFLFMSDCYQYVTIMNSGRVWVVSDQEFAESTRVVLSFRSSDCIFPPGD